MGPTQVLWVALRKTDVLSIPENSHGFDSLKTAFAFSIVWSVSSLQGCQQMSTNQKMIYISPPFFFFFENLLKFVKDF